MNKLLSSFLALLTAVSCYSAGGDGDEGSGGSAGTTFGGSSARGGSSSAGSFFGGSSSGGTSARGGSAGSGGSILVDGCRSANDCSTTTSGYYECVPPGATPVQSDSCGAVGWCGQCACGPEPQAPYGTGSVCDDVTTCPNAETAPGFDSYASVCDLNGQCTACAIDDDCPTETPRCAAGRTGSGNECFECVEDLDCPELTPHCIPLEASYLAYTPGGACHECATTADCALGVCVEGTCQPQCVTADDCPSEFSTCDAEERCSPAPCTTASECASFGSCVDGGCARTTCVVDGDCSGGACVNGYCYSGAGACVEHFAYP
jgi:hypothetical protein